MKSSERFNRARVLSDTNHTAHSLPEVARNEARVRGWAQLAAVIIIQESIGPWDGLVSYQTDQSPSPRF